MRSVFTRTCGTAFPLLDRCRHGAKHMNQAKTKRTVEINSMNARVIGNKSRTSGPGGLTALTTALLTGFGWSWLGSPYVKAKTYITETKSKN